MAKPTSKKDEENRKSGTINDIKQLDSVINAIMRDQRSAYLGADHGTELTSIYSKFDKLVRDDSYRVMRTKNASQSTYDYLANTLIQDRGIPQFGPTDKKTKMEQDAVRVSRLEQIFAATDMNATSMFLSGSSDVFHICDEVESVCAYMYQLDEAINVLRDNILNAEQTIRDYPFEITFDTDSDKNAEYVKTVKDALNDTRFGHQLNNHLVPKTIKFGRYYHLIIPFTDIGVKMIAAKYNNTHSIFNIPLYEEYLQSVNESTDSSNIKDESGFGSVLESVDTLVENLTNQIDLSSLNISCDKEEYLDTIKYNLENLLVSDESTPPNILGITEATFNGMTSDLQNLVKNAITDTNKKFNASITKFNTKVKDEDKHFSDSTIDPQKLNDIPGCYTKIIDPRQLVPIRLFDYTIGYYYFENYDYSRMGTTVTDTLSNQINFKQHNLVINNIVNSVLKNLKYGDIIKGSDDFKTLVLNCIFYAERLNNPIRIKFVPTDYVVEYKTNCDENDNGQPVLLKSLIYARLYISLLLFNITTIITKSSDTEFYYLRESALSQSYEDQVADIIDQFRNSNIDISQILSGNLLHGNRAINKRYFVPTGTQDNKLFDIDVVSGQSVDTHNDFMTDLKKMAIGSTGVPSVAIDYMDEIEFATILKMTNLKTMARANNIQKDLNPSITESIRKLVRYNRPNAIPEDVLETMQCTLKPSNKINNDTSADEVSNSASIIDMMIENRYGEGASDDPRKKLEIDEVKSQLMMLMNSSLPWAQMDEFIEQAKITAVIKRQENKVNASNNEE